MARAKETKQAFDTPWELCTPEQRALREAHLPRRNIKDAGAAHDAETVRRYQVGLPLSSDSRRRARRLLSGEA